MHNFWWTLLAYSVKREKLTIATTPPAISPHFTLPAVLSQALDMMAHSFSRKVSFLRIYIYSPDNIIYINIHPCTQSIKLVYRFEHIYYLYTCTDRFAMNCIRAVCTTGCSNSEIENTHQMKALSVNGIPIVRKATEWKMCTHFLFKWETLYVKYLPAARLVMRRKGI